MDQSVELHKARAERLRAVLRRQSIAVMHTHALDVVAATHRHRWPGLLAQPDSVSLPIAQARQAMYKRLTELGYAAQLADLPDEVLTATPGLSAEMALQSILPAPWSDVPLPRFRRAIIDVGSPLHLELAAQPGINVSERLLTRNDMQHIIERLGGLTEERAGVPYAHVVVLGDEESLTVYSNHTHPGIARALRPALGGDLLLLGPSYDQLGPRLRDIAQHGWRRGWAISTYEWSGGITGAATQPGPGLLGAQRVVADDYVASLDDLYPVLGQPTLAVIEMPLELGDTASSQQHAAAVLRLAARGVRVAVDLYVVDRRALPHHDAGRVLLGGDWQPTIYSASELPPAPPL